MKVALSLLALLSTTACTPSSLILSSARNEYRILNSDSMRQNVEKHLGAALREERITPPVPLEDFKFPEYRSGPDSRFTSHRVYYSPGYNPPPEERQVVAVHCTYRSTGKIVPHGYAGDAAAVTLMTLGLGEIITLPMAIGEVTPDASIVNDFEVWYSTKGRVLAYYWTWRSEKEPIKKADPVDTDNGGAAPHRV
ncbi:MAG: hypothetical protein NVV63_09420 [Opitutus sp.]|nr:hypothetical protein [Opitutus sp.]